MRRSSLSLAFILIRFRKNPKFHKYKENICEYICEFLLNHFKIGAKSLFEMIQFEEEAKENDYYYTKFQNFYSYSERKLILVKDMIKVKTMSKSVIDLLNGKLWKLYDTLQ